MKPDTDASPPHGPKPRAALAIATAFGLGYIPWGPGTWGSLLGVLLAWALRSHRIVSPFLHPNGILKFGRTEIDSSVVLGLLSALAVAAVGVWASDRAAKHFGQKDPQRVVMDEVSGQIFTLLSVGWILSWTSDDLLNGSRLLILAAPDWKYLLLGFILFRVFDIWKPFPVRQAEKLPGGWGIMADDWVAAVYAACGLWLARYLGL